MHSVRLLRLLVPALLLLEAHVAHADSLPTSEPPPTTDAPNPPPSIDPTPQWPDGPSPAPTFAPTTPPADAASAPPTIAPTPPTSGSDARIDARPGRGITFTTGDAFSLTVRPRVQIRDTLAVAPTHQNDAQIRTLRLWLLGHVLSPDTRFGVQLAFGGNDFEQGSSSPIFDAFLDFRRRRDASVKVGQYFVPFDRMRTIREFALETVDRALVVQQLTLDRDVGITLYSDDLGGHGGRVAYALGVFNGEGRNRFEARAPVGFLYTARLSIRPFGGFDDDTEGDLERRAEPRLAIGLAGAYGQHELRTRATTGPFLSLGSFDTVHGAVDVSFKWRGIAILAEAVVRGSPSVTRRGTDANGAPITETPSRAIGYVAQASYVTPIDLAFYARWDEIALPRATDPALRTLVATRGRELSVGVDYYLNDHWLKFQLDAVRAFGREVPGVATTTAFHDGSMLVRAQLDATF